MKNLCSSLLAVSFGSYATRSTMASIWMMTVVEGKEDLHEVIPHSVFGDKSVISLCLLDDGAEVTTSAIFHEDVENASISVNVSIVIAYNVFMVEVLENVSSEHTCMVSVWWSRLTRKMRHSHFSNDLLTIPLRHPLKIELFASKNLAEKTLRYGLRSHGGRRVDG